MKNAKNKTPKGSGPQPPPQGARARSPGAPHRNDDYREYMERRPALIAEYATHEGDTGSGPVQIALLTARIDALAAHLHHDQRDYHSRRGLLSMVGKRKRLLTALAKRDPAAAAALVARLGLRSEPPGLSE